MRRLRRPLKIAVTLVVVVVVIALAVGGALVAILTERGFPTTSGTLAIPGLDQAVTVTRDANGIPWIEAETTHDLFLAQGYVHAQDRMWQMEVWRHISSGRLSELFGASTLDEDRFIRTLGWRQAAERDLAAISPEGRAALDAYAQGVNAWIADHNGKLSLPFVVTGLKAGIGGLDGYPLERWSALDTLAWQKVQAWQLGGNYDSEVFRMLADRILGDPTKTDELFPPYGADMPVITPSGMKGSGGAGATATAPMTTAAATPPHDSPTAAVAATAALAAPISDAEVAGWHDLVGDGDRALQIAGLDAGSGLANDHQIGSNDFVVAASKSKTKTALLANDPHLGIGMPSVWYVNGLRCHIVGPDCPYDVVGMSFPGVPGVVVGHNASIAWGVTNVDPDVQDLFSITPDPANPTSYLHAGQSLPFELRHETIKVAGSTAVEMDVRSTVDGPILNDVDDRLKDGPLLALRWTATDRVDDTFDAFLKLDTATDFAGFRAALKSYGAPSQNFVYADVKGHIGYQLPGAIPVRADAADRGDRIRSGSDGAHDWKGTIPFDDLPWQLDPPSGLIVSANNAAVDARYPHVIGEEWDPGYRAARITDLLQQAAAGGGVTTDTLRAIQTDTVVTRATSIAPFLAAAHPTTADGALLEDRIRSWSNHDCPADSVGCAAYLAVEYRLGRGLFDDELGPIARDYAGSGASWPALIALLNEPASAWWDDVTTTGVVETRDQVIAAALDEAGRELRAAYGDPAKWTWGALHQTHFQEATLGSSGIGPLEWYFNKGPFPASGAAGAVENIYWDPSRAYVDPDDSTYQPVGIDGVFSVTTLPSFRLSIDLGALDGAQVVTTTGQSGNPFDRHYGDLIDDWLAGRTVPLPFGLKAIHDAAVATLELVPKTGG